MLDDRDLGEAGGNTTGHAPSWCVVLSQWMAASLSTQASTAMDGSPPPTPTGDERYPPA
jgi:hypothetical protein